jgi:hypothetical protein
MEGAMAQSLKIGDNQMEILREAAELNGRSVAGQAEHWMRLGRAFESHPQARFEQVQQALQGQISVDQLPADDRKAFFGAFMSQAAAPSAAEDKFWADRRARGAGVGSDGRGGLVKALPGGRNEAVAARKPTGIER